MDIALLNEKVTFQKHEVVTDDIGNHTNSWKDYYSCACTISGEGGGENYEAGVVNEHPDLVITIRWCRKAAVISITGYRVVFKGEIYDIESIDHMNYKKKCLKLKCRKESRSG